MKENKCKKKEYCHETFKVFYLSKATDDETMQKQDNIIKKF
jgi:hypothetical protein